MWCSLGCNIFKHWSEMRPGWLLRHKVVEGACGDGFQRDAPKNLRDHLKATCSIAGAKCAPLEFKWNPQIDFWHKIGIQRQNWRAKGVAKKSMKWWWNSIPKGDAAGNLNRAKVLYCCTKPRIPRFRNRLENVMQKGCQKHIKSIKNRSHGRPMWRLFGFWKDLGGA